MVYYFLYQLHTPCATLAHSVVWEVSDLARVRVWCTTVCEGHRVCANNCCTTYLATTATFQKCSASSPFLLTERPWSGDKKLPRLFLLASACPSKDPGLLAVARGCPKLEKLMLTGCGSITGKSVRALARGCMSLRDLSLSGCGGVGNGDLRELAKGCKGLRHLNIAECAQVRYGCQVEGVYYRGKCSKLSFDSLAE